MGECPAQGGPPLSKHDMTKIEAAQIIDAIRQSVEKEPGEFQFSVTITGTKFASHGGGVGAEHQVAPPVAGLSRLVEAGAAVDDERHVDVLGRGTSPLVPGTW